MSHQGRDDIMLQRNVELPRFPLRSTSMCIPVRDDEYEEDTFVPHTGPLFVQPPTQTAAAGIPFTSRDTPDMPPRPSQVKQVNKPHAIMPEEIGGNRWSYSGNIPKNEHLMMSGPLGQCDNPDCVNCPPACKNKRHIHRGSNTFDSKFHAFLYEHGGGWKKEIERFLSRIPVMNPHAKVVQQWNQFFVISCLVAIFIDPLFFFLLSVQKDNKCIVLNWHFATALAVVRSVTDAIYFLHMLLQFRLAYVAPESRVVGAGDLVDKPKKIAVHYLHGYFLFDFFVVLPLPQVMILLVIPKYVGLSTANYAKNLLRITVLLQYVPRIIRFVPLLGGQSDSSANGFIFESAWANFVINLLMFVLAGHVVGSCWYLFGLQRVNQCLRNACSASNIPSCDGFIDCGRGINIGKQNQLSRQQWFNDSASTACFDTGDNGFHYGIYEQAVLLTTEDSAVKRYIYSLFWGFQQISTLAGNLVPSYFAWEVLFTMGIIGLGLLLFALLIGNMQNFLQALGRRYGVILLVCLVFIVQYCLPYYPEMDLYLLCSYTSGIDTMYRYKLYQLTEKIFSPDICLLSSFFFDRRLEMQLRRRDVEQWMSHRRLPEDLRRRVRRAERFTWAATQGVNEEELLSNLPEDIQRDIRRHFVRFLNKVELFTLMDWPILDAICDKLRQNLYISGSDILYQGGPVEKMVFIVRGKLESISADGSKAPLHEGDVCGEELLTWYSEHSSANRDGGRIRFHGMRLVAIRTVRCLTNVEAFVLRASDLEEVTKQFSRFLRNPRVQAAIRYESPYWRTIAATRIQVAWRYRNRRLMRARMSNLSDQSYNSAFEHGARKCAWA